MASPHLPPRSLLRLALWAGMLGGLGEMVTVLIRKYLFHRYIFDTPEVAWMAPPSLAFLSVLVSLPLMLFVRSRFGERLPSLPYTVLAFLALVNATPAIPNVHPLARVLLLAGIAWQLGGWAARHAGAVERLSRRTVLPILVLVGFVAFGVQWRARIVEQRALASLAPAAAEAPNILLLILDTVRAMDLGLYGYGRATTPVLDQLGKRGVVFDRAYAPSSWTLATHASLFTGVSPSETGVDMITPLNRRLPTLAEVFRERGYATAGFVANLNYTSRESGLARGFARYEDFPVNLLSVVLGSSVARTLVSRRVRTRFGLLQIPVRKSAKDLRHDVLAWLDGRPADRPFFAFVNFWDAHAPYLPPPPFDSAFTGSRIRRKDRNPFLLTDAPVTRAQAVPERDAYNQVIASQDREIGLFLAELEARGRLRNTLIVVTSDHGEEFGEHGLFDHGTSLNPAVLWVPLVLVYPGQLPEGVRVSEPVSLVDVAATALTLADPARPQEIPGSPLLRRGGSQPQGLPGMIVAEVEFTPGLSAWNPASRGPLRSLTLNGWHYVRDAQGGETLMDTRDDLAGRTVDPSLPAVRDVVRGLRAAFDSITRPGPVP